MLAHDRLPRDAHPGAWWLWALALATAASRTTNPLLLGLIIAVTSFVVVRRRGDAPWARGYRYYLALAAVVVLIRVVFRVLLGGGVGSHVLVTLPSLRLPDAAAGITLGGRVTVEAVLAAAYDGLRLATMLVCLGAANALANPKRLLKLLPGALFEVGVAVVVALSVAPQLIESVLRVRRARRLRGGATKGRRSLAGTFLPVLEDALDRSLHLAASMDSRGYGRRAGAPRRERTATGALTIIGLLGICIGLYGLLGSDAGSRGVGVAAFLGGGTLAAAGLLIGGRSVRRSRYRPDVWASAEWIIAGCGVAAAAVLLGLGVDAEALYPSLFPLRWPDLPIVAAAAIFVAALPGWLAPAPPPRRRGAPSHPRTAGAAPIREPVDA